MGKQRIQKVNKKARLSPFFKVAFLIFVVACVSSIISTQAVISQKKSEYQQIQNELEKVNAENAEYERLLDSDNEAELMENIAIDELGYAYPNEIRFYDISRD